MNCGNCGKPLEPGSSTCPHCGALNMGFQDEVNVKKGDSSAVDLGLPDDVEEFVDEEQVVTNENGPIVDNSNVDIIPEITKQKTEEDEDIYGEDVDAIEKAKEIKPESIELDIPTVQEPVAPVENAMGINEVDDKNKKTVGEVNTEAANVEEGIEPRNKVAKIITRVKRTKTVPVKMCVLLVVFFAVMGIVTGKLVFSKNICITTQRSDLGKSSKIKSNGKKSETRIGSFIYKIPSDSIWDRGDNGLYIYSTDDSWRIYIKEEDGLYNNIATAKKSIKETVKANGLTVDNVVEKEIEEKLFVIINNTEINLNRLTAFTDAGHDKVFFIEIVTATNTFSEEVLAKAANILKDVEYVEEQETNMEKIAIKNFANVIIKATDEYKELKIAEDAKTTTKAS